MVVYRSWQVLLLLVLSVYTFIPFEMETDGAALQIRSTAAMLLSIFILVSIRWRLDRQTLLIALTVLSAVVLAGLVSTSGRIFVLCISIFLGVLIACAARDDVSFRENFSVALEVLLAASSLALILQVVIWKGTGEIVRIHEIVFPMSEARVEDHEYFARMGGVYIEPGTFSNWSCLLALVYRFLVPKPRTWLMILVGSAMVISLSAWGVAAGATMVLLSVFGSLRRGSLAAVPLVGASALAVTLLFSTDVLDFFEAKSSLESDSGDSKIVALNEFIRIFSNILLFGQGFAPDFCRSCLAPQDAGILIGFSVVFGVLVSALVFFFFYVGVARKLGISGLVLGAFVALSKVFYWDFILWTLLFLAWVPDLKSKRIGG